MTRKKKIIVTVTNDLTHDQRVRKVCNSLMKLGYEPHLVGRKLFTSEPIERLYPTTRFKLVFTKGAIFYAEYNLRLFLFLLFKLYFLLRNFRNNITPNGLGYDLYFYFGVAQNHIEL